MAAPEKLSPTIERLRELLAQCEELRLRSRTISDQTARMIADTERRIADCIACIQREKNSPRG